MENQGKTQKIVPKNQVVLPKLEGDLSMKQMKDIEREMDLEMSKMFDKEMNEDMWIFIFDTPSFRSPNTSTIVQITGSINTYTSIVNHEKRY